MQHLLEITPRELEYTNNTGYRIVFRKITNMNNSIYVNDVNQLPEMDDETLDEYHYDETAVNAFLQYVVDKIRPNRYLVHLAEMAAGTMFSTDMEIGIAVLCSYTYLPDFFPLLQSYFAYPRLFSNENPLFLKLLNTFMKR